MFVSLKVECFQKYSIFNSVHFEQPKITNSPQRAYQMCKHTTSLTFDLTPEQEKLPRNRRNPFTGKEKGRTLQESNRGGSLYQDGQKRQEAGSRRTGGKEAGGRA